MFSARFVFAVAVFAPAVLSAGQNAQTKMPTKPSVKLELPASAVANPDGTWSYKDKQGKHWTYMKTPFGLTRLAASGATAARMPTGIPKGAVRNADGSFTATEKDGKKWEYHETPFGISRTPAAVAAPELKVTDKGDTVRFERIGPMGPSVWEKKKTDLNDEERKAWETRPASAQTARPE
ncbi:MAG TPA: hypothetical protein VG273_00500 [Bryobacteraceae bacterium]|jgi:hypothetical protein|nr:hypothetical protein [Bryobacteraceae bacterium]